MFVWAERLGILGKKAAEKRVPDAVFEFGRDEIALFLGRLWTGDGFIANAKQCVPFYATSSARLARDVQSLLLRLGIVARIHEKRFRYRGGHRVGFTVHVIGDGAVERFESTIVPHIVARREAIDTLRMHLLTTERGRTSKDTVPPEVAQWIGEDWDRAGLTPEDLQRLGGVALSESVLARKCGYRRSTLWKVGREADSRRLRELAASDVYWDRVVSIEYVGEEDTYDLTVEHDHNFVADGLIVHNSHSAAYAMVAYQCAWLKAHYPAEFMAATMTSAAPFSNRVSAAFTMVPPVSIMSSTSTHTRSFTSPTTSSTLT